eukprot:g17933.t1
MTASWTRSENHEQTKLGALDETQPSRRPIVAPLNGLVNASGGLHSRASYTPRSAPRTMRTVSCDDKAGIEVPGVHDVPRKGFLA